MAEEYFPVFIQPVYSYSLNWNGYNLVFREDIPIAESLFFPLGEEWAAFASIPDFRFFFSLNPDWLRRGMPGMPFPAHQVVFILQPGQVLDGDLMARCEEMETQGFRFAVISDADSLLSHSKVASIAVLSAAEAKEKIPAGVWKLKQNDIKLFVTGINSKELFKWCADKQFAFHTFASLDGFRNPKDHQQGSSKPSLMKLLTLVSQDAENHEIELALRQEPKLSFDLLRLVNSASMGMHARVSSFSHALTILGRRQLQRWLQLLVFAHQKEGESGPCILMQRAAARGRLMELLTESATQSPSLEFQEQAFMVGIFSLLDILMNMPMAEILKILLLADSLDAALSRREGTLGEMLKLVESAENLDFDSAAQQMSKLKVAPEAFCLAQASALNWTHQINIAE
ncbi:MAG: HDOD domain-containing protein [Betaproteobacteria bacterium]|nr:HDOD domain-containing protein [Betaproteobacteria bacterium]